MSEYAQSPAAQVKQFIIRHLRGVCGGFSLPLPTEQVRGVLDVTGTPKDAWGIVVDCEDLGDHGGMDTGRVLVDVRPTLTVYTHIDEDADGIMCDSLAAEALESVRTLAYSLSGWLCHYSGLWTASGPAMNGAYRVIELAATLPLNRIDSESQED